MIKKIIRIIIVLIVAIILELVVFNYQYFVSEFDEDTQYNLTYNIDDMVVVNWERDNNGDLISGVDSNLFIENINTYMKRIVIEYNLDNAIPEIDLFYTDSNNPYFNADNMFVISNPKNSVSLDVGKEVKDLRIDLSDMVGLKLTSIDLVINPIELSVSISRILAIVLIYISFKYLFALQKSPMYNI